MIPEKYKKGNPNVGQQITTTGGKPVPLMQGVDILEWLEDLEAANSSMVRELAKMKQDLLVAGGAAVHDPNTITLSEGERRVKFTLFESGKRFTEIIGKEKDFEKVKVKISEMVMFVIQSVLLLPGPKGVMVIDSDRAKQLTENALKNALKKIEAAVKAAKEVQQ